jgi:hypothetical protein
MKSLTDSGIGRLMRISTPNDATAPMKSIHSQPIAFSQVAGFNRLAVANRNRCEPSELHDPCDLHHEAGYLGSRCRHTSTLPPRLVLRPRFIVIHGVFMAPQQREPCPPRPVRNAILRFQPPDRRWGSEPKNAARTLKPGHVISAQFCARQRTASLARPLRTESELLAATPRAAYPSGRIERRSYACARIAQSGHRHARTRKLHLVNKS